MHNSSIESDNCTGYERWSTSKQSISGSSKKAADINAFRPQILLSSERGAGFTVRPMAMIGGVRHDPAGIKAAVETQFVIEHRLRHHG